MTQGRYATPEAFKQALEARLRRAAAAARVPLNRHRQLLLFDRLLARLVSAFPGHIVLKGGVALELRLPRARTTRDVDLRLTGSTEDLLERLQGAGRLDLGDHLAFVVTPDADTPEIDGEGMVYGGRRFRVEARLAGRLYGSPFGLDIGFGDPLDAPPDVVDGSRELEFVGVAPVRIPIYPLEAHVAEKLHAYTLPRDVPNTRVKDIPDLALLGMAGRVDAHALRRAIDRTFGFRETHPVPGVLPPPPASWAAPYARMASADSLPWPELDVVFGAARTFLDHVLGGQGGTWNPEESRWR